MKNDLFDFPFDTKKWQEAQRNHRYADGEVFEVRGADDEEYEVTIISDEQLRHYRKLEQENIELKRQLKNESKAFQIAKGANQILVERIKRIERLVEKTAFNSLLSLELMSSENAKEIIDLMSELRKETRT